MIFSFTGNHSGYSGPAPVLFFVFHYPMIVTPAQAGIGSMKLQSLSYDKQIVFSLSESLILFWNL